MIMLPPQYKSVQDARVHPSCCPPPVPNCRCVLLTLPPPPPQPTYQYDWRDSVVVSLEFIGKAVIFVFVGVLLLFAVPFLTLGGAIIRGLND